MRVMPFHHFVGVLEIDIFSSNIESPQLIDPAMKSYRGGTEFMPKISYFVYCSQAVNMKENGDEEYLVIQGPFASISLKYLPGMFSFSVAFSFLNLKEDKQQERDIRLVFRDEKGDKLLDTDTITLPELQACDDVPAEHRGINLCMDYRNVLFSHAGVYYTDVYVASEKLGSYPIYVNKKTGEDNV